MLLFLQILKHVWPSVALQVLCVFSALSPGEGGSRGRVSRQSLSGINDMLCGVKARSACSWGRNTVFQSWPLEAGVCRARARAGGQRSLPPAQFARVPFGGQPCSTAPPACSRGAALRAQRQRKNGLSIFFFPLVNTQRMFVYASFIPVAFNVPNL